MLPKKKSKLRTSRFQPDTGHRDLKAVFCCGMSRSGGTLQYQWVKELIESYELGGGVGFPEGTWAIKGVSVFKTEQCQAWMTKMISEGEAVGVGTYRDPRDVAVSLMHFFKERYKHNEEYKWTGSFEEVISTHLPAAIKWQGLWEQVPGILWQPYEMIMESPLLCVMQIAGFLSLSSEHAPSIVEKYSLDRNVRRQRGIDGWIDRWNSMLTKEHISPRRGRSTWETALTREQVNQVEASCKDWMKDHGYN